MKGLNTVTNPMEISSDAKLIVSRLERIFFTKFGSVLGNYDFGSIVASIMYEDATEGLSREILRESERIILDNEGNNIDLEILYVNFEPFDNNGNESMLMEIGFSFFMKGNRTELIKVEFFRLKEI